MTFMKFHIWITAGLFGAALASGAQSTSAPLPATGVVRPANVPAGYQITPFGYFHPSCVQSLAKGERLLQDGRVQHADGTVNDHAATCSYSHYTAAGKSVVAAATNTSPEISGWVENANVATGSASTSYGGLLAVWTVPPHPLEDDGQFLYFFPGLEDIYGTQSILQPVLAWHAKQWSVASWNCCLSGIITESAVVNVSPGDVIYGSITSTCPAGSLSCSTWNVLSLDLSTGQSTTLSNTPSDGQTFDWAFGGVMEPYYVVSCKNYPPDHALKFDFVTIFDQNLNAVSNPDWSAVAGTTATPQCHYAVETKPGQVKLHY